MSDCPLHPWAAVLDGICLPCALADEERRCLVCGHWRSEHIGADVDDPEMQCPVDPKLGEYFQTQPTFVPSAARHGG